MVELEGNPENRDSQMGETETETAQTEANNEQQQPQHEVKKRKTMAPRSDVWESFSKIKVGDVLKAKCKCCNRELRCDPRTNVCTQDWLRRSLPANIEEDLGDLAKIEEAIVAEDVENSSKEKSKSESVTKPSESTT